MPGPNWVDVQEVLNRVFDSTNNALKVGTGSGSGGLAAFGVGGQVSSTKSGIYQFQGAEASTLNTLGNGTVRVAPVYFPVAVTLTRIGAEITSAGEAGSVLRLGIWNDLGTGYPGTLLLDAGTIDGTSATVQEITISQAVSAGLYWIGGAVQAAPTTQPTVRTAARPTWVLPGGAATNASVSGTDMGFSQGSVSGAFGTFSTTVVASGGQPRVFWKIA